MHEGETTFELEQPADKRELPDTPEEQRDELLERFSAHWTASTPLVARLLILSSYIVLFSRIQDFPGLGILGTARLPMVLSLIVAAVWLFAGSRVWSTTTKLMLFWLAFEGMRGVLGRYFDPNDTLVRNDFWQFHTWKDLSLQFFGLGFPIAALMANPRALRAIARVSLWLAVLLSAYALTHQGRGPGGFIGDENDLCLVLLMLFPFALFLLRTKRSAASAAVSLGTMVLTLGGIVATSSRGGFLGLVAVIAEIFRKARRKLSMFAAIAVVGIISIPFIPARYIDEIASIRQETRQHTGTIQERIETWKIAATMFADPRHTIFGVGLENAPMWTNEYEPPERGKTIKSLAGRKMHSLYFQLLTDLGLFGVAVIGAMLFITIRTNNRLRRTMIALQAALMQLAVASKPRTAETPHGEVDDEAEDEPLLDVEERRGVLYMIDGLSELEHYSAALAVAWAGVLVSGLGVSVLYYPPIWFLICVGAAHQRCSGELLAAAQGYVATFESKEREKDIEF